MGVAHTEIEVAVHTVATVVNKYTRIFQHYNGFFPKTYPDLRILLSGCAFFIGLPGVVVQNADIQVPSVIVSVQQVSG